LRRWRNAKPGFQERVIEQAKTPGIGGSMPRCLSRPGISSGETDSQDLVGDIQSDTAQRSIGWVIKYLQQYSVPPAAD